MIFIIGIIVIVFTKNSFGKYVTRIQMESNNEVAEPIIEIEKDETININKIENKIFNIKIKNYNNDEKINEVDLEYYLELIVIDEIKIKIYRNNEEIKLHNKKTEKILLSKNSKQEDNYKIEILFFDNSAQEIFDEIKMKIYYEQKNM